MNIVELTEETFEEGTKEGTVVVDFWAEWCGPCKALAPALEAVASETDDVGFAKVDMMNNMELARKHRITSIPCLVVFKDGEEVDRMVGFPGQKALKEFVDNIE